MPDTAVPPWLRETPIAHRGLHDATVPENSLGAFAAAAARGFGVELDVHVTADHGLVVMHDADTARTTGVPRTTAGSRLAELQELELGSSGEHVPSLAQVLETVGGAAPVLVEVKTGTPAGVVGPLLAAALEGRADDVAVQSFDPRIVRWFAVHAPRIPRGQLSGDFRDSTLPAALRPLLRSMVLNVAARPQVLAYDVRALADPPLAFWRRVLGAPLLAWTVRDAATLAAARAAGANVIFEGVDPG